MNSTKRIALAAVLSPWSAPALIIIGATLYARRWPFNFDLHFVAGVGVLPAYGGLLLVGLPLFFWLRKTNRLDLLRLVIGGVLGGIIFLVIFSGALALILRSPLTLRDLTLDVVWGVILSSAVALTFGFIVGVPGRARRVPQ
jgi:hypothetical protein